MKIYDILSHEYIDVIDVKVDCETCKYEITTSNGKLYRYSNEYIVTDNTRYELRMYYSVIVGKLCYDVIRTKACYAKAYEHMKLLMKEKGDNELFYPSIPMKYREEFLKKVSTDKYIYTIVEIPNTIKENSVCRYCCVDIDDRDLLLSDGCDGVYIDGNNQLVGDDAFNFDYKKINFCPICGRKL